MSDKVISRDKINLSKNGQIIQCELETAEFLNNFFLKHENLVISNYQTFIDSTEDKTLRAVLKYKNHPSIIAIQIQFKNAETFYFTKFKVTDMKKPLIS